MNICWFIYKAQTGRWTGGHRCSVLHARHVVQQVWTVVAQLGLVLHLDWVQAQGFQGTVMIVQPPSFYCCWFWRQRQRFSDCPSTFFFCSGFIVPSFVSDLHVMNASVIQGYHFYFNGDSLIACRAPVSYEIIISGAWWRWCLRFVH